MPRDILSNSTIPQSGDIDTNHLSQKIAKDTKTNLGNKGAAPGDNPSTGPALGWFSKMGISL
jgi:hypothetical protein